MDPGDQQETNGTSIVNPGGQGDISVAATTSQSSHVQTKQSKASGQQEMSMDENDEGSTSVIKSNSFRIFFRV